MSNIQLHWVQLRVSALCIGHHQVVLRLVEELYNKRGILGGGGTRCGRWRGGPTTPTSSRIPRLLYNCSTSLRTTWWWPIHRAETRSCTQCNYILLTENIVVLWQCVIHKICCWINATGMTHLKVQEQAKFEQIQKGKRCRGMRKTEASDISVAWKKQKNRWMAQQCIAKVRADNWALPTGQQSWNVATSTYWRKQGMVWRRKLRDENGHSPQRDVDMAGH